VPDSSFGTPWLVARLAEWLPGFPNIGLVVALSGGVDSTVLLAALAAHRVPGLRVRAVHVDHGLHPNASKWCEHCRMLARSLGVPLEVLKTRVVKQAGVSLEAAARDARYAMLAAQLAPGEFLLTGHHEDDQLETVLLQLFRGAGLAGLAAMPPVSACGGGWLARPLLSRTRAELQEWARGAGLSWVEDDTNADETLDRNYLRRRVLPLIRDRWKGVGPAVSRSARHAAEGQRLLDLIGRADVERASSGAELFVPTLRALQPDRRRNALRFWIAAAGARMPDTARLEELAGPVIDARPDSNPRVSWGDVEVRRHADLLAIIKRAAVGSLTGLARISADRQPDAELSVEWSWKVVPVLELIEDGGTLELKPDPHGPIDLDAIPATVTVSRRRGGERLRPRRGGPRRSLKSLLQESHLPIAQRGRLPLLFSGATLLAVGSLWVDESIQFTPGTLRRGRLVYADPPS
jgi:tRNA(Ile)-lysidine synthase